MKKSLLIVLVLGFFCIISIPQESVEADSHLPFPNLVNELFRSGNSGSKVNLVIIGDGFQAGADQVTFDAFVDNTVMDIFNKDLFEETKNAFNVYSINLISNETGVTQVTQNPTSLGGTPGVAGGGITSDSDGDGIAAALDTVLGYEYSGDWNRCWMEGGSTSTGVSSNTAETNLLNFLVPQWDYAIVILNESGFGACASGNIFRMTLGTTWSVVGHEFGHSIGGLGDEYIASAGTYTGGEPSRPNLTISNNRNTIKWGDGGLGFVDPNTAIPTPFTLTGLNATACGGLDPVEDAGVFAGGTRGTGSWTNGIFRAHCNDRMDSNRPPYGAVNYYLMRTAIDPFHDYDFDNSYVGDFNGDNKDDLVLHNDNSLALYVSTGSELELDWIATPKITNWEFKSGDKFYVGDFSGDGLDDLFVVNHTGWHDGSPDNPVSVIGMLRSTGSGFVLENRFDDTLPGWDSMKSNDEFFVADFNGDGLDDLFVFNGAIGVDWDIAYLQMLKSTGKGIYSGHNHRSGLDHVKRYDDTLPGWDSMKSHDKFFVADIDGDGLEEIYVFNGLDWDTGYLHLLKSTGAALSSLSDMTIWLLPIGT